MPLSDSEWQTADEQVNDSAVETVRDFLRTHPDMAYSLEEIVNETGVINIGSFRDPEKFETEGTSGPEDVIAIVYSQVIMMILTESGDVDVRSVREESSVKPGGDRGVRYYRYSK